jgi:lysophospholipase L1-like esterase
MRPTPKTVRRPVRLPCALALAAFTALTTLAVHAEPAAHSAVTPAPRGENWMKRHESFNERVKQGNVDLIFVGDSITQGWEGAGKEVWARYYGHRNAVNLGIGGDRTQHVLWRLDHGNVNDIQPKAAVIMIGTNNSGANRNTASEMVDGVTAVVKKLREKLPQTRLLLLDIFPRGEQFNGQRGKILQVNQAIRKLHDNAFVHYLAIGHQFLEADGSISKEIMPDFLHFTPGGYAVWASSIESKLSKLLGDEPVAASYLGRVRDYADALIENARDTHGEVHSPLFAVSFNRQTYAIPDEVERKRLFQIRLDDWQNWGIRNGDRVHTGANPMLDQDFYQILYALTALTGDSNYEKEADKTLEWFFKNCQSPTTGLLPWGEHTGWDFMEEKVVGRPKDNPIHEFAEAWVLWDRSFELATDNCVRYAQGLWEHQIGDHETGDFSRHAHYITHKTDTGNGYPRHGGFYITVWSEAYERTQNPLFLKAIKTLLGHFVRTSHPETGAIPCCTVESRATIMWPDSNISLAVDLWDGADRVPEELANAMRARAKKTDEVFLSLDHDFSPAGKGFVCGADTGTLERFAEGNWTDSDTWATSYGKPTDAPIALICKTRYDQTKNAGYRNLVVSAADRYLLAAPEKTEGLHPATMGEVVRLLLAAHDLTENDRYVARAKFFADWSIELFLGDSPLPSATPKYKHYEIISGGDTLMLALLDLWARTNKPDVKLDLQHAIR